MTVHTRSCALSDSVQQFIGKIVCGRELGENLFLGHVIYPEQMERPCIIQFLANNDDQLARRRFAQEAMLGFDVSRDHQNLVSTLHFGKWDDGRLFLAVDCVEGRALSEVLDELRGNFVTIRAIADAALRALLFLHGRGVAHGAVEAENILMGADGIIRLGNFNKARYMTDREDGSEDFRALGALLFFLVTGRHIGTVDGDDIQEHMPLDSPAELILAIAHLLSGHWPGPSLHEANLVSLSQRAAAVSALSNPDISDPALEAAASKLLDMVSEMIRRIVKEYRQRWMPAVLSMSILSLVVAVYALWQGRVATVPQNALGAAGGQYESVRRQACGVDNDESEPKSERGRTAVERCAQTEAEGCAQVPLEGHGGAGKRAEKSAQGACGKPPRREGARASTAQPSAGVPDATQVLYQRQQAGQTVPALPPPWKPIGAAR